MALERLPVPAPGPGEVVIRSLKTGICGADVHIDEWDDWAQRTLPTSLIADLDVGAERLIAARGAAVS